MYLSLCYFLTPWRFICVTMSVRRFSPHVLPALLPVFPVWSWLVLGLLLFLLFVDYLCFWTTPLLIKACFLLGQSALPWCPVFWCFYDKPQQPHNKWKAWTRCFHGLISPSNYYRNAKPRRTAQSTLTFSIPLNLNFETSDSLNCSTQAWSSHKDVLIYLSLLGLI